MPVQTEIEKLIPTIYKRSALNLSMFGFVRGVRATLPTVTVEMAISMFAESYGIDEEAYNLTSARSVYFRMQKELLNLNKSDNGTD